MHAWLACRAYRTVEGALNRSMDVGFIGLPLPAQHRVLHASVICGLWRKPTDEAALLQSPELHVAATHGLQTARGRHHDYASALASRRFPPPVSRIHGASSKRRERTNRTLLARPAPAPSPCTRGRSRRIGGGERHGRARARFHVRGRPPAPQPHLPSPTCNVRPCCLVLGT